MARPNRGGFEAWLRGGQTVGHTFDMIREVLGRLLIVSIFWVAACFIAVNHYASEKEQVYGFLAMQAQFLDHLGKPFPQTLSVPDLAGQHMTYPVGQVRRLAHVKPFADEYYRLLRWGSLAFLIGVVLIAGGTGVWFMESGRNKLKLRQIRGQVAAPLSQLILEIDRFNSEEAKARSRPRHVPARLVGVPYPFDTEHEHTLIAGSPGSGKTRALHQLLDTVRARQDRGVIYDPELEFIENHYDPDIDVILNPFDARSVSWSPFNDAHDLNDFKRLGHGMFKNPKTGDPYWTNAARQVFVYAAYSLRLRQPDATLDDLLQLLFGPTKGLQNLLRDTPASKHLEGGAGPRVSSLESVLAEGVEPLIYLAGGAGDFSIREWVNHPKKRPGFFFLSAPETYIDSLRPLIGFWAEIVVSALLGRHDTARLTTWLFLDEFPSLDKIEALADGPQRLRKYGGAIVLGMQQVSQIQDIYGHEKARTILGQCATKLILRAQDPETAQFMSEQLGRRLVRRVDENTSYGANSIRDGVGLTPREELEPIALPEDVMNLPKFQGFIRVSNAREGQAFPIAPLKFYYGARNPTADPFVPREGPDPVTSYFARLRGESPAAAPREPEAGGLRDSLLTGLRSASGSPATSAAGGPEARPEEAQETETLFDVRRARQAPALRPAGSLEELKETSDLEEEPGARRAEHDRRQERLRQEEQQALREGAQNERLVEADPLRAETGEIQERGEAVRPEDRPRQADMDFAIGGGV